MDSHQEHCEACRAFPLYRGARIFWDACLLEGGRNGAWDWMDFLYVWDDKNCGLCRLIRHAFKSHYGTEQMSGWISRMRTADEPTIPLRIYRTPLDVAFDEYHLNPGQRTAYYLELTYYKPPQTSGEPHRLKRQPLFVGDAVTEDSMPKLQVVVPDSKRGLWPLLGRRVEKTTIDWDEVQRWLRVCKSGHKDAAKISKPSQKHSLSDLLVVDVQLRCIVQLPPNRTYVALSYQCGKDQEIKLVKETAKALRTAGSLDSRIPSKTIVDAMYVARALEFRYLWVDCLCIVQDSPQDLAQKIGQMHEIYDNAALTIVAAAGQDPEYGLPGVSRIRDEVQMTADLYSSGTNTISLANLLDNQSHAITTNRWNTRAWTYQERLLSRKLLIFTTSQVYFTCSSGCEAREDVHMTENTEVVANIFDERYAFDVDSRNVFERFAILLQEYSRRSMSDSADKINAFSGLLNRLAEHFEGASLFGTPTTLFDVGLLWLPVGHCVRGDIKFPSWSWAGWTGPVWYEEKDSLMNFSICNISIASIESAHGQLLCNDLFSFDAQSEHELFSDPDYEREFDEVTEEIAYRRTNVETNTLYPRPMRKMTAFAVPPSYMLRMFTLVTEFRLATEIRFTEPFRLSYLQILDEKEKTAGIVYVDKSQVESLHSSNPVHRFAALSRATLYCNSEDRSWDNDLKSFRLWHHPSSRQLPHCTHSDDETAIWQNNLLDYNLRSQGQFDDINSQAEGFKNYSSTREVFPIKEKLPFDPEIYNKNVYWPVVNVLLLKELEGGSHVERLGIGKIHVDAFMPRAKRSELLLG